MGFVRSKSIPDCNCTSSLSYKYENNLYDSILFSVAAMTVSNGDSANGESNGHTAAPVLEKGSWTVGLVNSRHKYLSAETFGFKINANGKTMKKKQVSVGGTKVSRVALFRF